MGKRANENAQQSREDWEGAESNEEAETAPPGTFQRASEDELNRRKIRRVSGQYKSPAPSSASSSNPFAIVSFSSTTAPPSTSTNPFANILLQPSQPADAAVWPAVPTGRLPELIQAFQTHIQDCRENRIGEDWSRAMQQYKEFHRAISLSAAVAAQPAPVAAATAPASAHNISSPSLADAAPSTANNFSSSTTPPSTDGVMADPDSKWKKFHETKAKCFCFKDGKWSAFTGSLSLEYAGNSKVLVIREVGHLRLNVALPTDIEYHEDKNTKGVVQKSIQFLTKEKAEDSPFMVRLRTAPQNLTPLYNAIQELAAKST